MSNTFGEWDDDPTNETAEEKLERYMKNTRFWMGEHAGQQAEVEALRTENAALRRVLEAAQDVYSTVWRGPEYITMESTQSLIILKEAIRQAQEQAQD